VNPFSATLQANERATAMQRDYLLSVNPDPGFQIAAGDLLRRHRVRGAGVGLGREDQGSPLSARTTEPGQR